MNYTKLLLPCSKCAMIPAIYRNKEDVKIRCSNCGNAVVERNYEEAAIVWNCFNGSKKKKSMAIVEFKDHHYERATQLLYDDATGKIRFGVNGEEYLYNPNYFEDEFSSICCGVRNYTRRSNSAFLKRDESIGKFYITDDIIQLLISKTDEGIEELEHMLQTEERQKEENEMKDILELVGKIEELLKKSKFEWFMCYDHREKSWNFQIKEK